MSKNIIPIRTSLKTGKVLSEEVLEVSDEEYKKHFDFLQTDIESLARMFLPKVQEYYAKKDKE